jgi:O-antigen/teichoic acid export membrane protein
MSQRNEFRDIVRGIFLLLVAHIIAIVAGFILGYILILIGSASSGAVSSFSNMIATVLLFSLFGIGISQWLYVTPLLIRLRRRERWGLFKGVLIGALLTMLLNGGCFLWFFHP